MMGREYWAVPGGGGFAPSPPGFSALVEATESALGLLPSMALSSAQLRLIITAAGGGRVLPDGCWSMALYFGGKIQVDTNHLPPQGGNST